MYASETSDGNFLLKGKDALSQCKKPWLTKKDIPSLIQHMPTSTNEYLHAKKNLKYCFTPSEDIADQKFCNLIGQEAQLARSSQRGSLKMLFPLDNYFHTQKNNKIPIDFFQIY